MRPDNNPNNSSTMTDLCHLIYTSYIDPNVDTLCVDEIVRRSRLNNRKLDVTGLLLFDGLCFCEYLEGPEPALSALLDEIRGDGRHFELNLLQPISRVPKRL